MTHRFKAAVALVFTLFTALNAEFITTKGHQFIKDGKPYYFMGANFWYGMNLAVEDNARLLRELDFLKDHNVTNLRIMGSSQGPEDEPYRMIPALERGPNITEDLNETLLEGLDILLDEMQKRNMTAVIPLNNFWYWSGGFAQYVHWFCDEEPIPYPDPENNVTYEHYTNYTRQFYVCEEAIQHYKLFFKKLAERKNTKTGVSYMDDTTIMAWQIANEPTPAGLKADNYTNWLKSTIVYMKEIDKNHLVSVGIEGLISDPDYKRNSELTEVDYLTCHLWAQNWGWYDPKNNETFENAKIKANEYLTNHIKLLSEIDKPFVLEEFGLARDDGSYEVDSTTEKKDIYYEMIFERIYDLAKKGEVAGVNFWAWAGEGKPPRPGEMWAVGDPWTGDPPHEPQGWYSVYKEDTTVKIITDYAGKMKGIEEKKQEEEETNVILYLVIAGGIGLLLALVGIILYVKYGGEDDKGPGYSSANKDGSVIESRPGRGLLD